MRGSGITRRQALQFLGGGAVGTMLTPLPWKLLDDLSIWSQNGPNAAATGRGPVTTRFTHCTLCPAGCGLRVRCIGGRPVSLAPVADHPRSPGGICLLGLAAHHLAFHPHRQMTATRRRGANAVEAVSSAVAMATWSEWVEAARRNGGRRAVLDLRPERPAAGQHRRWLAAAGGSYLVPVGDDATELRPPATMLGTDCPETGLDLARVRTLLSFGAPVLEGWMAPGLVSAARRRAVTGDFELVQVEARPSRTALQADRWLAVRPGCEAALALGLAHMILAGGGRDEVLSRAADAPQYRALVAEFPPERVATLTGIDVAVLRDVGFRLAQRGPSVAVPGVDPGAGPHDRATCVAVWGLNFLLGALGPDGAYVARCPLPEDTLGAGCDAAPRTPLAAVPRGSVNLLLVDASAAATVALPWDLVRRALAPNARVAWLATHDSTLARHADLVLPVAAPFETWQEVAGPAHAARTSYALAAPFAAPRVEVREPSEWIARLAGIEFDAAAGDAARTRRVAAIHAQGRGVVFQPGTPEAVAVTAMADASDLWRRLADGACWIDAAPDRMTAPHFAFLGTEPGGAERLRAAALAAGGHTSTTQRLELVPFLDGGDVTAGALPMVIAKVFRESNLRRSGGTACMHPRTATEHGLVAGQDAHLETAQGRARVCVAIDAAVQPGIVHVAVGPDAEAFGDPGPTPGGDVLAACDVDAEGTWKRTAAALTPTSRT